MRYEGVTAVIMSNIFWVVTRFSRVQLTKFSEKCCLHSLLSPRFLQIISLAYSLTPNMEELRSQET
jgi:hypothetical protein